MAVIKLDRISQLDSKINQIFFSVVDQGSVSFKVWPLKNDLIQQLDQGTRWNTRFSHIITTTTTTTSK